MTNAMLRVRIAATIGLIVLGSKTADAGPLNGHELTLQNLFHGAPSNGFTVTFTVESTPNDPEVPNWANTDRLSIDVYDTGPTTASILITMLSAVVNYGSSPNLIDFTVTNHDVPTFESVVLASTNITGLTSGSLGFTGDRIDLDIGSLANQSGKTALIDITTASVPEPSALVMSVTAVMLGVGWYASRRQDRKSAQES